MANKQPVDTSKPYPGHVPETEPDDAAAELAALTANRPLQILNEELGKDPYNHTGRFSKPAED